MTVINKTNKNYKRSQKGRSMVEMLGVLAIVGVLSVGGISAYGVAMKKHKANELLHQASMLATTVSAQAMTNNGTLPTTIMDFGSSSYGTFSKTVTEKGNQFVLTIEGLDSDVCDQLKKGGIIQNVQCVDSTKETGKKDAQISYYKNLTTNEKDGYAGGAYGPQVDGNGCYEVSYKGGRCCDIDKTVKVCPGDAKPDTSCTPNPPRVADHICSCEDGGAGKDGDGWYCTPGGTWMCPSGAEICTDGPLEGRCEYECSCDAPPEGEDGWSCDTESGVRSCPNGQCTAGAYAGKCMKSCCSDPQPYEGWECQADGTWNCFYMTCGAGPDAGKCVEDESTCPCREGCNDCGFGGYCRDDYN